MISTHSELRARYLAEMPKQALFVGLPSTGKWTLAQSLASLHEGYVVSFDAFTSEALSNMREISHTHTDYTIVVRLAPAESGLLTQFQKCLDMSSNTFLAVSSAEVTGSLSTQLSVFRVPRLSEVELVGILMEQGVDEDRATYLASISGGQVGVAQDYRVSNTIHVSIVGVTQAILNREYALLELFLTRWTDMHTSLMARLCQEVITGRWKVFDPAEVSGVSRGLAMQLLKVVTGDTLTQSAIRVGLRAVITRG